MGFLNPCRNPLPSIHKYVCRKDIPYGICPAESIRIGDRTLLVSPVKARDIRDRIAARKAHDMRIADDLRTSAMLPSSRTNQFAGWIGRN